MTLLPDPDRATHDRLMESQPDEVPAMAEAIMIAALAPLIAVRGAAAVGAMLRDWADEIEQRHDDVA